MVRSLTFSGKVFLKTTFFLDMALYFGKYVACAKAEIKRFTLQYYVSTLCSSL